MLADVGPASFIPGFGAQAISYAEIEAWVRVTGLPVSPWEGQALRHLSRVWVSEHHRAKDKDAAPPWRPNPNTVADKLRLAFGAVAKPAE